MSYYKKIRDRDVWVVIEKPLVYTDALNAFVQSERFSCAYKIEIPPNISNGVYLRDANGLRWFDSEQDALDAALDEVTNQLNP